MASTAVSVLRQRRHRPSGNPREKVGWHLPHHLGDPIGGLPADILQATARIVDALEHARVGGDKADQPLHGERGV